MKINATLALLMLDWNGVGQMPSFMPGTGQVPSQMQGDVVELSNRLGHVRWQDKVIINSL